MLPYGIYDIGAGSNNYSRQFEYEFDFTSGFAGLDFILEQVQQFDGGVAGIVHLNEGDNSTVFINIWNHEDTYNDYTYSDENGAYALQLLNGTYNIYAWAEGYEAFYVGNAFTVENNVVSYNIYFIAPDGPESPTIVFFEGVNDSKYHWCILFF